MDEYLSSLVDIAMASKEITYSSTTGILNEPYLWRKFIRPWILQGIEDAIKIETTPK
jgi:hypothetical protein